MALINSKHKKLNWVYNFILTRVAGQFGRYTVTGLLAAGIEYSLLIILTELAELWYIVSNSIAYFAGFWVSFLLNKFWSFKSKGNFYRQLLLYIILFGINLVLTNGIMYFLTSIAGIPYMISKVFVMGCVVLWNFVIFKKVIYKN